MPIDEIKIHADVKTVTAKPLVSETVVEKPVASIETQTGRSLSSPVEELITRDFTVTYNQPVDVQIQTQMSQPSSESEITPKKETINISKRITRGEETIQIATKPMSAESQPIVEEPDDILVEANYRKRPESETGTAELNISNVLPNQPFETVFVEPDETTTEVIVDADGSKRIIVKKLHRTVVRHQQTSQQQQLTTLSTVTEGDVPVGQTFSQITLKGQQSATTLAKGDGSKATITNQQFGGKVVSGVPGGGIDVNEYQTEPETQYSIVGPTYRPEEVEIQGIKLHEGDITFVDNQNNQLVPVDRVTLEGSEIHTSSSSVRAVVQQVTRRIIRKTRRIIRRTVIIDGKEHVTEEIVEEPEEIEVTEEGIPRVSINVTRTEDGQIVQQQQFGDTTDTFEQPGVTVTQKTTTVVLDSDGKPIEKLPENVTVLTQPEQRYVLEHHAQLPESTPHSSEIQAQQEVKPLKKVINEFIETERLTSPTESRKVLDAPSVHAALKDQHKEEEESRKAPKDESWDDLLTKDTVSIIPIDQQLHPTNVTSIITPTADDVIPQQDSAILVFSNETKLIQTSEIRSPTESPIIMTISSEGTQKESSPVHTIDLTASELIDDMPQNDLVSEIEPTPEATVEDEILEKTSINEPSTELTSEFVHSSEISSQSPRTVLDAKTQKGSPLVDMQTIIHQTEPPVTTDNQQTSPISLNDSTPDVTKADVTFIQISKNLETEPETKPLEMLPVNEEKIIGELPVANDKPESAQKETVTTQTSFFLEMEKSLQDRNQEAPIVSHPATTQTSVEHVEDKSPKHVSPQTIKVLSIDEVVSPEPTEEIVTETTTLMCQKKKQFEKAPVQDIVETFTILPDSKKSLLEETPDQVQTIITRQTSPLEGDRKIDAIKDDRTEYVEQDKLSEIERPIPSAPPYEGEVPHILENITVTEQLLLPEKSSTPEADSKSKKIDTTPKSLLELQRQDAIESAVSADVEHEIAQRELISKPLSSEAIDIDIRIQSEEVEAVPKMEEHITDMPKVMLEKADITTIVSAEKIETNVLPEECLQTPDEKQPDSEKLPVSTNIKEVAYVEEVKPFTTEVDSVIVTKSTTVTMAPVQKPQELLRNIKDELQGSIEIQQTEEVTSFTKEPTGNVEMFLSLEETTPSYTLRVDKKSESNDFLENERKDSERAIPSPEVQKEMEVHAESYHISELQTIVEPISKITSPESDVEVVSEIINKQPIENLEEEKCPVAVTKEVTENVEVREKQMISHELPKAVEIILSLKEKLPDEGVGTPTVSIAMKVEEDNDRADILQKDIHVQLPKLTSEKTESISITASPIVPKLEVEYEEPATPSDIDHGGRRSKKKKKHKESKSPTPIEKDDTEEKPESFISSLDESIAISIPEDSVKSEQTPQPTKEVFDIISESTDDDDDHVQEIGYEADKTTVDESLADDDDREHKKRRKKKRRQKIKTKESDESHIPKSAYESSPLGDSIALTDDEPTKLETPKAEDSKKKKRRKSKRKQSEESEHEIELESENTIFEAQDEEILSNNESYHTISTPSEPHTVKIIEEGVIKSPTENAPQIISELVLTVPILEAVVTQEMVSQTTPVTDIASEFLEQEREISKVIMEQTSVQTSPEAVKETVETSIQTLEEPKELELPKPEVTEISTQIEISTSEIVTQTSPKSESPEQKDVEPIVATETLESSVQTISPTKPEIVEEAVQTVTPETPETTQQEPPIEIPKTESGIQATVECNEGFVQTQSPETVQTTDISTQIQPDVSELALQTSPEPSAPPFEQQIQAVPLSKTEVMENVSQTSPVIIHEVGEILTPSPTPTPTSSEQYEVHVQASVLVPSDVSDTTTTQTEKLTFVLTPSESSSVSTPSITQSGKAEVSRPSSESEGSSDEEYDVHIAVDGISADKKSLSEKFIVSEKGEREPHKHKRKRGRKIKKHHEPAQESSIEKDFNSAFQRQDTKEETSDQKLLYADIVKRSRSPSPMPKEESTESSEPQAKTPDEEKMVQCELENENLIQAPTKESLEKTIIETKVTSKVLTDLDQDKVKKIIGKRESDFPDTTEKHDSFGVDISISLRETEADSPELEITTKDVLTLSELDSPTTFKIESLLTQAEHKQADQVLEEVPEKTLFQSKIQLGPASTISSTVDFIKAENISEDASTMVFINDQPVKLPAEKTQTFDTTFYTVTQPADEQKQKSVPAKAKAKNKHVSSVTIEEIQSPTIVTDTPLTPVSDVGQLSPPDYATCTWQKSPTTREIIQTFITTESQQGPLQLEEVNIKWNQAQALERFKNLQNASKTTHLSDVLYLATLNEIITDETLAQHNDNVQQNLVTLQNAIERRDVVIIQQSIIITVETITTWLETIEYRIYVNRQQTSEGPSRQRVQEFTELKQEIANIETKVEQLQSALQQTGNIYNEDDRVRMKNYIDSLQQQVRVIEEVTEQNEQLASGDLKRWEDFENGVTNITQSVRELKRQLSDLKESDASPQTKLNELEMLETRNRCYIVEISHLLASAKSLMRDFPGREIPREVYITNELTKHLEQQITIERERVLQYLSLADEYEQTLKEFGQIILVAEALIESLIMVRNLEHLENEMQNHRKFFVNLSHCRAILESLEENLDSETRALHSELHQNLYERAKVILDKSTERFKKMSLAASKWTVLEQGTREELRWLQVAQQRVPDLNSVTSSDFERYIDLYQSLAADIDYHHAKLLHLDGVAQKLQELIHCPNLEHAYTESLDIIQKLLEDVQNNLDRLIAFRGTWMTYNLLSDKVEYWLKDAEMELKKIESSSGSRTHLRQFWELKAQHEVHTATKQNASNALEKALQIVPISDEMVQRKFHSELNTQWQKVSKKISEIESSILETLSAPNIPVNEKLVLLEQELQDLKVDIDNLKGVLKTDEELRLYVERLQIMSTRLETIQNELGKLGLLSAGESDKVGALLGLSKHLEITIAEELEAGNLLSSRLKTIQKGLERVRRKQEEASRLLDQCESSEKLGSESVEKAVNDCYEVEEELNIIWQDLMSLRQLLHTLPMRLKVTVSPKTVERDISQLQDHHTALEKRCKDIHALLRNRLGLWQRFERQLELIQQSVKEADFMVEILTVQGTVDYERLRKATERLEVSELIFLNKCFDFLCILLGSFGV